MLVVSRRMLKLWLVPGGTNVLVLLRALHQEVETSRLVSILGMSAVLRCDQTPHEYLNLDTRTVHLNPVVVFTRIRCISRNGSGFLKGGVTVRQALS